MQKRATLHDAYVPTGGAWETVPPADAGLDPTRLKGAVDLALASDSPWPRSFYYPDGRYVGIVEWNETGPWSDVVGPVAPRGGPAGVILKGGRIVAEWGDTARADMTFSVAKSYLSVLAGLAVADGLIASVDEPVGGNRKGPMVREPAQCGHHLASPAAAVERVAGRALGQVGPGRPQPPARRRRRQQPQGRAPRAEGARHALRVQRRAREPAGPMPAAPFRPAAARGAARAHHGPDRRFAGSGSGTATAPPGSRSTASACSRCPAARIGAAASSSARATMRVSACSWRAAAAGAAGSCCPRPGSGDMPTPSPTQSRATAICGGSTAGRRLPERARLPASLPTGAGSNMIWIDPEHDLVAVPRWIDKSACSDFFARLTAAAT